MVHPLKAFKSEAAATAAGNIPLTDFFRRARNGRPKKKGNLANDSIEVSSRKKKKRGPVPKRKDAPVVITGAAKKGAGKGGKQGLASPKRKDAPVVVTRAAKKGTGKGGADVPAVKDYIQLKKKAPRTNWGVGEAKESMEIAVSDWFGKTGDALDDNDEQYGLAQYSNVVKIPYNTLKKYVTEDQQKRRSLGKSVGRGALLQHGDQHFLADVLVRKDRGNDGAEPKEAIDMVQQLAPHLDRTQARRHFKRTLLPNFKHKLKPKAIVAQATTTKRTGITVSQQFRWHTTYEGTLNELRRLNTGTCRKTGKVFGELIQHFIIGGDETCLMACASGEVRVIGSTGKRKHEKKTNDSRDSITMYRTGSVVGATGPTAFLLAGQKIRAGYTEKWLRQHGAADGSTLVMTPTAFMTTEAWERITPSIVRGYRAIDAVVAANPQWWMLEIFDGFGAHLSSLNAMQFRYDNRVLSLKEEGFSSHVNQAYDKFVAKSDKAAQNECLGFQRNRLLPCKGVVDQWGLVHTGLHAIRSTQPSTWTQSFHACNLDPRTRVDFSAWCKKIEQFLMAGQAFKPEGGLDIYALLPPWWHGMKPEEKKRVVSTVQKHGSYAVRCVQELHDVCHIPIKDMQNARLCVDCALKNPAQLNMEAPDSERVRAAANADVIEVEAAMKSVDSDLRHFRLHREDLEGEEYLAHMIQHREIRASNLKLRMITTNLVTSPSHYLNVEVSHSNRQVLAATSELLAGHAATKLSMVQDAGGDGAQMKLAKRKLTQLGMVKSHSGVVNSAELLKK